MTFKRIISYLKPYKKSIVTVITIVTLSSIISIFIPKVLGDFITSIYESITKDIPINSKYLKKLILVLSSFYLFNIVANYLENFLMSNICQKALYTIKTQTNEKLSKLSMSYYDTHSKGDLLSRFNNDLEAISSLYLQVIPKIFSYSITFIGTLIMMFYIDSILTLITLITLPLLAISSKFLLKFSKKKRTLYFQKLGQLNAIITESYLNQEIISLYNNDTLMKENFNKLNKDLAKTNLKATLITSLLSPLASLLNYLVYLLILVIGAKHVFEGRLKFGEIQSLIQYTKQLGAPINSFSSLLSQTQTSLIAANRVFDILDEKEEKHLGTETLSTIESIEFKNVEFSYTSTPFIKDLNFKINKGEKIAIVGETGSGKSTIINLLMQFYKISNGDILINNKSIYEYNINEYYKQTSLVTQDLWLFNDTIKNNLKYANLDANDDMILNICKKTNCFDLINKMPGKLNEIIDENIFNV